MLKQTLHLDVFLFRRLLLKKTVLTYFPIDLKSQLFGLRHVLDGLHTSLINFLGILQVTLIEGFVQPVCMEDSIHTFLPVYKHC